MANGTIKKINNPGTHGNIERADDGSLDFYQFRIPQDCVAGYVPQLNDKVDFTPITDTAQRAVNVQKSVPGLSIQSFSVAVNGDSSHTASWVTTGAATGKIRYTKQNGTTQEIDITAKVNSGSETISAADTALAGADGKCYTLFVFDAGTGSLNNKYCV